jgi:hypothetical protein
MEYTVTTIICPMCRAELDAAADQCAQCGAATRQEAAGRPHQVVTAGAPHSTGLPGHCTEPKLLDRPWMLTILLLHLGAFGIPLYWRRSCYSRSVRLGLIVVSILYTILVVLVIAWAVGQILAAVRTLS